MINPANFNIVAPQGATFDTTFTFKIDNVPVNLTGYTAEMKLRETPDSDSVIDLANGSGITLGGAAGTIAVVMTATQTAAIPAGAYFYDLKLTQGSTVTRLLQGRFQLSPEITYA